MKKIFCKTKLIIIICLYFVSSFASSLKTVAFMSSLKTAAFMSSLKTAAFMSPLKTAAFMSPLKTAAFIHTSVPQSEPKSFEIYPPEYDVCFKKVFVESTESKEILKNLLNTIYGYNGDSKIIDIDYMPDTLPSKESRPIYFDIKCRCYMSKVDSTSNPNNSMFFDIEMQRAFQVTFIDRINIYKARLAETEFDFNKKLKAKNYTDVPTIRMLSFLKYPFNKNYPFRFHMLPILVKSELQNGSITGKYEILDLPATNKELATFIQLSKLEECTDPKLKEWLHFLNLGGDNPSSKTCIDVYSNEFSNGEIKKALNILHKFSMTSDAKNAISNAVNAELALNTQTAEAKERGKQEGLKEGIRQGMMNSINLIMYFKKCDFNTAKKTIEKQTINKKEHKILCSITEDEFNSYIKENSNEDSDK